MFCEPFSDLRFFFFTGELSPILYYSHLPTIVASLLIGIFVLYKSKGALISRILFLISILISLWAIMNLFVWVNPDSRNVLFTWSFFGIIYAAISVLSVYFIYVFIDKKDISLKNKISLTLLIIPILILTSSSHNLSTFDISLCGATGYEGFWFTLYYYLVGLVSFIWIIYFGIRKYVKEQNRSFKKQILLVTLGLGFFMFSFFFTGFFATYLVDRGVFNDYTLEFYGLFGMLFFLSVLSYMIVKFKAFNIKLLGAQALVVALVILIGSQFAFVESVTNKILTAITLVVSSAIGLILVRSVKQVDDQKELLEQSNQEQEVLIHFISHQIKGFFTKTRNIFATILEDKNAINQSYIPFIEEGLRSDKQGIKTVTDILNAANLKTGKMEFKKTDFDLIKLVEEVTEENITFAHKKGLEINLHNDTLDRNEIIINADLDRIKDIFNNIIQNSIHYTEKGGINISFKIEGEMIKTIIRDTGIGLSDEDKLKLFRSGSRGTDSIKYNANSTGYGLYIAYKVATGHGGDIRADSKGKGEGSTFTITLPLK